MSDNKKYYYLKLKENFFESDTLILLETQKDGYLYSNILLKLYLRSLKNEGRLAFNDLIPYSAEMLATLTKHQVGTVEKALAIFEQLGLIEILDNGVIYMTDIQNFIGRSSSEADRQRDYQRRISAEKQALMGTGDDDCKKSNKKFCKKSNRKSTPEIEIEKEKEIEKEIEYTSSACADDRPTFEYKKIVDLFNNICISLPKVKTITEARKKKIRNAYETLGGDYEGFFKKVEASDFLTGRNGAWKNCCFDWIINSGNMVKILEGNYDNKRSSKADYGSYDDEF